MAKRCWLRNFGRESSVCFEGFLLPETVLSARELRFRVIYNCFRA